MGPIPPTDNFAGRVLEKPLFGGSLWRCQRCSLGFRWPRLSKEELDVLYQQGNDATWTAPFDSRRDWRIARDFVEKVLPCTSRILDVGCFDGGFLEPLLTNYRCFGIEIHQAAQKRAEHKGIEIVGSDFSEVAGEFDFVTAFDVIEHVERPRQFLEQCLSVVKPGGWVLISSGNLDAFSFRLMKSRYWYCTIAEHISFVSPRWVDKHATDLGYQTTAHATFSHTLASVKSRIRESAINCLYRAFPKIFSGLRRLGLGGKKVSAHAALAEHPPVWVSAKDHFIVMVQKR